MLKMTIYVGANYLCHIMIIYFTQKTFVTAKSFFLHVYGSYIIVVTV